MAQIDAYLSEILERRGSDLHFISGDPPRIRLYGDIAPLKPEKLATEPREKVDYLCSPMSRGQGRWRVVSHRNADKPVK